MANNNELYNAVVAGITAGNQKRWDLANLNDFTIYRNLVGVIATQIDQLIGPMTVNPSQIALMHSICEGYFQDQGIETIRHELPNVANAIAGIFGQLDSMLEPPGPAPVGETIPNGTYVGQPINWDGANWTPLPEEDGLKLAQINGATEDDPTTFITMDPENNFIGLSLNGVQPAPNQIAIMNYDPVDPTYGSGLQVNQNEVLIKSETSFGGNRYLVTPTGHYFEGRHGVGGWTSLLKIEMDGGIGKIGFFGAIPVPTQLISGAGDSALLESLVDALVAYGLIIDDR